MSPTGSHYEVRVECANMIIEYCSAKMEDCNNFDPEVQIEHNQQSARFTCTDNTNCNTVSPTTSAPETTTTTVVTSVPYCETTHTTTPSPVTSNSPTMCTPATVVSTVVTSINCETTHTTHSCETTNIIGKSHSTSSLITSNP